MAALLSLGRAAFDPAGSASPARLLVSDSYLFRFFAEEFAYQQPTASRLFVVNTNPVCGDALCRILDIQSDKWFDSVPEMPAQYRGRHFVSVNNRVFVFHNRRCECFAFDVSANLWSILPPMRRSLDDLVVTVIHGHGGNHRIYVMGKETTTNSDRDHIVVVEIFDVRANAWLAINTSAPSSSSSSSELLHPGHGAQTVCMGSRIYYITGESTHISVNVFDTDSNAWLPSSCVAPSPLVCNFVMHPVLFGHCIWCFGCYEEFCVFSTVVVYDIWKDEWSVMRYETLQTKERVDDVIVVGDVFWLVCGNFSGGVRNETPVIVFDSKTAKCTSRSWKGFDNVGWIGVVPF